MKCVPHSFPIVNLLWQDLYMCIVDVCVQVAADLFVERPPVAHKWPVSLPHICRQLWPLYTSAGIFLCAIPGGKPQLLVLSNKEHKKAVNTVHSQDTTDSLCFCSNHSEFDDFASSERSRKHPNIETNINHGRGR